MSKSLHKKMNTPALLIKEDLVEHDAKVIQRACNKAGAKLFFAMKSQSLSPVLDVILRHCDGIATSSLFEARVAHAKIDKAQSVHFTSPGLRPDEVDELAELCDFVVLNSLGQWESFSTKFKGRASLGLRVNPQVSFIEDDRYNPCRVNSKLGAPLSRVLEVFEKNPDVFAAMEGMHIHTNCESKDFSELLKTVKAIDSKAPQLLKRLKWFNLGGGYLFSEAEDLDPFYKSVDILKTKYGLDVFVEPGAALSRDGIEIVSSVIDLFESDDQTVAILDTTVNHMPDCFEYSYRPDVLDDKKGANHSYILAGGTCLAGDTFGTYAFDKPLKVGSKVVFLYVGAYNHVKSHMFNGINLPDIYAHSKKDGLRLEKQFTYQDFLNFIGA